MDSIAIPLEIVQGLFRNLPGSFKDNYTLLADLAQWPNGGMTQWPERNGGFYEELFSSFSINSLEVPQSFFKKVSYSIPPGSFLFFF